MSIHDPVTKLLLAKDIGAWNMIEKSVCNEVIKLLLVMKLGFFRNIERLFPVGDLFKSFAAIMPETAVVDKKLAGDCFSFVRE